MQEQRSFSRPRAAAPGRLLALGLLALAGCGGLGVERYREARPSPSLEVRRVAREERPGVEHLARLDGGAAVALEPGVVLRASHVTHVELVERAEGGSLVVLALDEEGRARLEEASSGGRALALVVDGRVVSTPTARGSLAEGEITLSVRHPERLFEALSRRADDGDEP